MRSSRLIPLAVLLLSSCRRGGPPPVSPVAAPPRTAPPVAAERPAAPPTVALIRTVHPGAPDLGLDDGLPETPCHLLGARYSADGRLIAILGDRTLQLRDGSDGALRGEVLLPASGREVLWAGPARVAVANTDGEIFVWALDRNGRASTWTPRLAPSRSSPSPAALATWWRRWSRCRASPPPGPPTGARSPSPSTASPTSPGSASPRPGAAGPWSSRSYSLAARGCAVCLPVDLLAHTVTPFDGRLHFNGPATRLAWVLDESAPRVHLFDAGCGERTWQIPIGDLLWGGCAGPGFVGLAGRRIATPAQIP